MQTIRAMPVLQVRDVKASEAFYETLGFGSHGCWGDPPGFCIMQRGDVTIALDRSQDGDIPQNQWWAAYVYVDDLAALHAELAPLDLPELSEIRHPQAYGCIDFDVVDIDGHRIAFGQSLNPVPGPGLDETRGKG